MANLLRAANSRIVVRQRKVTSPSTRKAEEMVVRQLAEEGYRAMVVESTFTKWPEVVVSYRISRPMRDGETVAKANLPEVGFDRLFATQ